MSDRRNIIFSAALSCFLLLSSSILFSQIKAGCPGFFLRDGNGKIINPISGENANVPFSTKQTCGYCHDYAKITEGYHFQQGWDRIRDDFGTEMGKPWVLSNGMMGKW